MREYGDICVDDEDCHTRGGNWKGFTYDYGACKNGTCQCADDAKTINVSYVEPKKAQLPAQVKEKTICVADDALDDVAIGDQCVVDPIFFSYIINLPICANSTVCHRVIEFNRHYIDFSFKVKIILVP